MSHSTKIYPQRFKGTYRRIKDILSIFLLTIYIVGSWLRYERGSGLPNQAIFIDLPHRKAYFWEMIIWPDELYYLSFLLILAAIGLFICTTLFGRIWCGYTCPHTIIVDLFVGIETFFQGDRNARIKLDSIKSAHRKFFKKTLTHILWFIVSFIIAFSWVGYFYDVQYLIRDICDFKVTNSAILWLIGLTFSTYIFAGFIRQKVCIYMCPYGRFQSGLMDKDTIIVTYDAARGEMRGKDNTGDCIDCLKCVIVCPMGIDIRDGLQMSCIGCGLCIDACDEVMYKINKPTKLIKYTSSNMLEGVINKKFWRSKVILYAITFLIVTSVFIRTLLTKSSIIMQIDKEHSPLFTVTPEHNIRNTYNLYILNKTLYTQENLCLSISGLKGATMHLQGFVHKYQTQYCFTLKPEQSLESKFFVLLSNRAQSNIKHYNIKFMLSDKSVVKSVFYVSE